MIWFWFYELGVPIHQDIHISILYIMLQLYTHPYAPYLFSLFL